MHYFLSLVLIAFFSISIQAQPQIIFTNNSKTETSSETQFRYAFDNEKFTTPHLELQFGADGKGEFRFKKKDSEEIVNKLQVTAPVLEQINSLLTEVNFLDSAENYQYKKDFSHLGTITISVSQNGKHREVSFNYTENQAMNKLANIFRNITTQETRIFEIEVVRQNDPISTPAQLRYLESELKSKNIADPERFTALLQELKVDESVPLIARNHADRLLKEIRKSKN